MKLTEYIGLQFGNPRGIFGRLCCIVMNIINKSLYIEVNRSVNLKDDSKALDIGYGNGYLIKKMYNKSKSSIYGIDISEDMRITAAKRNKAGVEAGKIHLEIGDCCSLKYNDDFFEAVTSVNTIYFWEDTLKGMKEIYRVLKHGGIFLNAVYSKEWMESAPYTKKGFKFFSPEEVKEIAEKAGFTSVEIKEVKRDLCYVINCIK